jgi:hypothetical protein
VVAKVRERLAVGKLTKQRVHMERFNAKKEQYRVERSNSFLLSSHCHLFLTPSTLILNFFPRQLQELYYWHILTCVMLVDNKSKPHSGGISEETEFW